MGKIIIMDETSSHPIQRIGKMSGICYGSDITSEVKNYKRGLDCLENNHGRTLESVDIYMILEGYSAKTVREFYTHIGGNPMRLQSSTRYIDYAKKGLPCVIPPKIEAIPEAKKIFIAEFENKIYQKVKIDETERTYDYVIKNEVQKLKKSIENGDKYKPYKYI